MNKHDLAWLAEEVYVALKVHHVLPGLSHTNRDQLDKTIKRLEQHAPAMMRYLRLGKALEAKGYHEKALSLFSEMLTGAMGLQLSYYDASDLRVAIKAAVDSAKSQRTSEATTAVGFSSRVKANNASGYLTPSFIISELMALETEFKGLEITRATRSFSVTTEEIKMKDSSGNEINFGPFKILYHIGRFGQLNTDHSENSEPYFTCVALKPNYNATYKGGKFLPHPHVFGDKMCTGRHGTGLASKIKHGLLYDVTLAINELLHGFYNEGFNDLDSWNSGACPNCGGGLKATNKVKCHYCTAEQCKSCIRTCEVCACKMCYACLTTAAYRQACKECGMKCTGCKRAVITRAELVPCYRCGRLFCKECQGTCAAIATHNKDKSFCEACCATQHTVGGYRCSGECIKKCRECHTMVVCNKNPAEELCTRCRIKTAQPAQPAEVKDATAENPVAVTT